MAIDLININVPNMNAKNGGEDYIPNRLAEAQDREMGVLIGNIADARRPQRGKHIDDGPDFKGEEWAEKFWDGMRTCEVDEILVYLSVRRSRGEFGLDWVDVHRIRSHWLPFRNRLLKENGAGKVSFGIDASAGFPEWTEFIIPQLQRLDIEVHNEASVRNSYGAPDYRYPQMFLYRHLAHHWDGAARLPPVQEGDRVPIAWLVGAAWNRLDRGKKLSEIHTLKGRGLRVCVSLDDLGIYDEVMGGGE